MRRERRVSDRERKNGGARDRKGKRRGRGRRECVMNGKRR